MTNINVRIAGSANLKGVSAEFGKLESSIQSANAQLAQMVVASNGVDPTGFNRMTQAVRLGDKTFRDALSSTQMFEVQQVRLNDATDDYVKKLQKQKLSFRDMRREWKVANQAYREQVALNEQAAGLRRTPGGTQGSRSTATLFFPSEVGSQVNSLGNRVAWLNEHLKSGATQLQNWGKNTQWAGRQLMVGLTLPIAAAGAAMGTFAFQVDKELTRIAKVYDTTADAFSSSATEMIAVEKELAQLRADGFNTATKAAREYGYAAEETLAVQAELAATGIGGQDLQTSTSEVMRISRLGEVDHQDAIKSTIALQTVFRQSTDELTESFNYMNAIENATSLSTQDFSVAIPIAAASVKAFGGDVQELGVLLTAMKSRGIEAGEGANAIKAAMQRLGRPGEKVKKEFQAITGLDIQELVDTSGSLTEIFSRLNDATTTLSAPEKRDVFAGLFGSYQVTRMTALVEGVKDLEDGTTQVARAAEIAAGSSDEWASIAAAELEKLQKSASFRFTSLVATIKAQLAELGEPVLDVANVILSVMEKVFQKIIDLPGFVKKALGTGLGLVAIAGPLVMLTGLLGNLVGTTLKGTAALASFLVKMKIASKESRIGAYAADMAEKGYVDEAMAVNKLALELDKLTKAQTAATAASTRAYNAMVQQQTARNANQAAASTPTAGRGFGPVGAGALPFSQAVGLKGATAGLTTSTAQSIAQGIAGQYSSSIASSTANAVKNASSTVDENINKYLVAKQNYSNFLAAKAPKEPTAPEKAKRSAYRRTDDAGRKALDAEYKASMEAYKAELLKYKKTIEQRNIEEQGLIKAVNATLPASTAALTAAQLNPSAPTSAPAKNNAEGRRQASETINASQRHLSVVEDIAEATERQNENLRGQNTNLTRAVDASSDIAENTEEVADSSSRGRIAAGSMAAAFSAASIAGVLLSMDINDTTNRVSTWVITSAGVAMALGSALPVVKAIASGTVSATRRMVAFSTASAAGATGLRGALVSLKAMAAAAWAAYGPIALVAGILAGAGLYAFHAFKENEKASKALVKTHEDIANSGKTYADEVGRAYKSWVDIDTVGKAKAKETFFEAQMTYYNQNEEGIAAVKAHKDSPLDNQIVSDTMYAEALSKLGMTTEEAQAKVEAFFMSTGESAHEAEMLVGKSVDSLGTNIKNFNFEKATKNAEAALVKFNDLAEKSRAERKFMPDRDANAKEIAAMAEENSKALAAAFNELYDADPSPEARKKAWGNMKEFLDEGWDNALKDMEGDTLYLDHITALLDAGGLEGGADFGRFIQEGGMTIEEGLNALNERYADENGSPLSGSIMNLVVDSMERGLAAALATERTILDEWAGGARGYVGDDDKTRKRIELSLDFVLQSGTEDEIENKILEVTSGVVGKKIPAGNIGLAGGPLNKINELSSVKEIQTAFNEADVAGKSEDLDMLRNSINRVAKAGGFKIAASAAETLYNILNKIKAAGVSPEEYAQDFDLKTGQRVEMYKSAMEAVQSEMADAYRDDLEAEAEADLESKQKRWDSKVEAAEKAAEREERSFDRRWEAKEDRVDGYWQGRIDAVNRAIKAEEKADEARQRMFDAEIARIRRLSEVTQSNLNFNVALRRGDLDEAARISATEDSQNVVDTLESARAAGTDESTKKTDALSGRIDNLEVARDKRKEALDKQRDDEKRNLDERLEAKKKALQSEIDSDMKAQRAIWENRKKSLGKQLELFLAFTPRNEKELKEHTKRLGLTYKGFGGTLEGTTDGWASHWDTRLRHHLTIGAEKMSSDKVWSEMSKGAMDLVIKGLGFKKGQFKKWINSWKDFDNFGASGESRSSAAGGAFIETNHAGGVVGAGGSGRKGVARTLKGLHSSEQMVRAQKGEFVVNRKDAYRNSDLLNRINSGEDVSMHDHMGGVGGAGGNVGIAGLIGGVAMKGLMGGVLSAVNTYRKAELKTAAAFGPSQAVYGTSHQFSESQIANAKTIRRVGLSMGMSERDILIGLMTAMQESTLYNIDHGDRDSLGLFQQRPSQGWGSPSQVTDPTYAARKFFEGLSGISGRNNMRLTEAAQAVQRSAFPEAYAKHEMSMRALLGIISGGSGGGSGKYFYPSIRGKGWRNSHDYANPIGTPLYSYMDGTVVDSRAVTTGGSAGNGRYATPYRSYGETIAIRGTDGNIVRYAHLDVNSRYVRAGDKVKGGQLIGRSGNTGNSTGPHTHFDVNGSYNASEYFKKFGVPLKKGGTIQKDGTPAVLHKNERVLTANLTKKLDSGIDMFFNISRSLGKGGFSKLLGMLKGKFFKGDLNSKWTQYAASKVLGFPRKSRRSNELYDLMETYGALSKTGGNKWKKMFHKGLFKKQKELVGAAKSRNASPFAGGHKYSGLLRPTEAFSTYANAAPASHTLKTGTYKGNAKAKSARTQAEVAKMMGRSDILTLMGLGKNYGAIRKYMNKRNWGSIHGGGRGTSIAYNKKTQLLESSGSKVLGGKKSGGYANYGLLSDRKTGAKAWHVAANTLNIGNGALGKKNKGIFENQWKSLDSLVARLEKSHPVVVSGNVNVARARTMFGQKSKMDGYGSGVDPKSHNSFFKNGTLGEVERFTIPGLKVGGDIKWDNTIANLHKDERVLTAPLTKKLDSGLDNLANGAGSTYNVTINASGASINEDVLADKVITRIKRLEARKPQSRRIGG